MYTDWREEYFHKTSIKQYYLLGFVSDVILNNVLQQQQHPNKIFLVTDDITVCDVPDGITISDITDDDLSGF